MASKNHEHGTKHRILRLFRAIQEQPFRYTKKELAELAGVHLDTIKKDIVAIRNVGYELECDNKRGHRYGFAQDYSFEELKQLLELTEEEQLLLLHALRQVAPESIAMRKLSERLSAVFGFQSRPDVGYASGPTSQVQEEPAEYRLQPQQQRRPYLTKFQLLEQAQQQKVQVVLVDYRSSNSNEVRDRLVEPFLAKMEDDTVQAYDVEKKILRHFLLSRIRRIQMTDQPWQYEHKHQRQATDPFRIVDDDQELVHLRLKVGAYNELVERYPLTKAYIQEDGELEHIYDFQCSVNHKFYGLTNFILGFHHQIVEVIAPERLKEHLRGEVEKMKRAWDRDGLG
jgi:predicted DNA-binding transcriptional regulator YafY